MVQDNLKIFVGGENSPFHSSGDEKLDRFDYWLYQNRLVQIGQLDRKDTLETISMNRINFTYSSSRNKYEWFRFILWFPKSLFFELTNLNQSVVVQPVIKQVQFLVRRKMERSIFTSNKNFKFILNQLGYFKGQVFCSLIMKYRFSRSMLSFTGDDLTYHA